MAQFVLQAGCVLAKAWVVCVDLDTQCAEASLMLIVSPEHEGEADAAVRVASDGEDVVELRRQLAERLAPIGIAGYLDEIALVLSGESTGSA